MKPSISISGFVLFILLTLAVSAVAPRPISASAPFLEDSLEPSAQQEGAPSGKQQARAPRRAQDGSSGSDRGPGTNHSQSPRNGGDHSQVPPPQPNPDPRPSQPPRPGGPGSGNPEAPGSGPSRPPAQHQAPDRPAPRPPVHQYPPIGPRPGYPRPGYVWGRGNRWRLYQYFLGNRPSPGPLHRQRFYSGGYFPVGYLQYMQPVPAHLLAYLPPVPDGCDIGYYNGYCVIYDLHTLRILSVLDLYRF